ncbi:hypothetical protein EJ110_NYTH37432 [Nymphaea thermarum]|nr:hypothetical protein EJ110_NYTH37432 [Nymphaea thermarum]
MGCTQSRVEQEEAVARCKERRQFMRDAVAQRNALAAAHSLYAMALKHVGAALNDYGQGEVLEVRQPLATSAPADHLPPPPPPPPDEFPGTPLPPPPPPPSALRLQKATSMPNIGLPKQPVHSDGTIQEEEDDAEEGDGLKTTSGSRAPPGPPSAASRDSAPPPLAPTESSNWQDQGGGWQDFFFTFTDSMPEISVSEPPPRTPEAGKKKPAAPPSPSPTPLPPPPPPPTKHEENDEQKPSQQPESISGELPEDEETSEAVTPLPPKAAKKPKESSQVAVEGSEAKRTRGGSGDLMQILHKLDEQFLKASESGQAVTKMLEAHRLHYHSNFTDDNGDIDHSAQVMRLITWNQSLKEVRSPDDRKGAGDAKETETLATILDQLLAWEKKLYDEVKIGETMKFEYQRKMALLNKQKKRGVSSDALERTKAAVSHLHTRYIVDMQSMDSTVSEIYTLRDDQLYPKLVELVNGLAGMWETMHASHMNQKMIVDDLKLLDISNLCTETTETHHKHTEQLCNITNEWSIKFEKLLQHQKEFIQTLNRWVRLSLIPIESSLKEKVSSPTRLVDPPIKDLLKNWNDELEHLSHEVTKNAIISFSAVVKAISGQQEEELNQKHKCEDAKREYDKKLRSFQDWLEKYKHKRGPEIFEGSNEKDPVLSEKECQVELSKRKWDEELETYQNLSKQTREKSLASLKTGLPTLFNAIAEFSTVCSESYKKLLPLITSPQHPEKTA